MAFPPLDEALSIQPKGYRRSSSNGPGRHEQESEEVDSPAKTDLTIEMQSLIHPDSFSEDLVYESCGEESLEPASPLVWKQNLESPARDYPQVHIPQWDAPPGT